MGTKMKREELLLIYDKECPACNNYCQVVQIRESVGDLKIVDARENSEAMDEITSEGLDIDQGMVLKIDDCLYFGADTIHALALLGSRSGVFNKVNYWIFKSKSRSRFLYPILKLGRNMLLKILGRTRINNLETDAAKKF